MKRIQFKNDFKTTVARFWKDFLSFMIEMMN